MSNEREMIARKLLKVAKELVGVSAQPMVRSKADAVKWFKWLKKNRLDFHMDDNPEDVRWAFPVSDDDLAMIYRNHAKVWRLYDSDELWEVYGEIV